MRSIEFRNLVFMSFNTIRFELRGGIFGRSLATLRSKFDKLLRSGSAYFPHEKRMLLKEICLYFEPDLAIETGTYFAESTRVLSKVANSVISIEVSEDLARFSRKKLSSFKNVQIELGSSDLILRSVNFESYRRLFFWLDAHYSGGSTSGEIYEQPLLSEVRFILTNLIHKDLLILIDDVNLFVPEFGYPKLIELTDLVSSVFGLSSFTHKSIMFIGSNELIEKVKDFLKV